MIREEQKGTNIVRVNEEGTSLVQINHEFISVGESIAQIKRSTAATVTERGTIVVSQFKQEINSRGEDVWYYENSHGTFESTLSEAKIAFPDVNFEDIKEPETKFIVSPKLEQTPIVRQPLQWETVNEYDGEKTGNPATWGSWGDGIHAALDIVEMIPAVGELANCIKGVISLVKGNYAEAASRFSIMTPFLTETKKNKNFFQRLIQYFNPKKK